jgi:hypothetical protein
MGGRYTEAEAEPEKARFGGPAGRCAAGLLVNDRHFSEMSDIDIAVEGITDPAALSALRGAAEKLTHLPLDIVAIEHVHPAYAAHIRRRTDRSLLPCA